MRFLVLVLYSYLYFLVIFVTCIALCRDPSTRHLDGYKPLWMGRNTGGQVKKGSKTIDIVSYALEVSVNGATCVFTVHFRSLDTF